MTVEENKKEAEVPAVAVVPNPSLEQLFGSELLKNAQGDTVKTTKAFEDVKLIGLYFSASWCPPCKHFSPLLKQFYSTVNEISQDDYDDDDGYAADKARNLEIIYVSSDRTIPSFEEYYLTLKPFFSIPINGVNVKTQLAQQFQIMGIPTLIIINAKTRNFITADARNVIMTNVQDQTKSKALVQEWIQSDGVALENAKQILQKQNGGHPGGFIGMLLQLLRNPMVIVGIFYYLKLFWSKYIEAQKIGAGITTEDDVVDVDPTADAAAAADTNYPPPAHDDSEF